MWEHLQIKKFVILLKTIDVFHDLIVLIINTTFKHASGNEPRYNYL